LNGGCKTKKLLLAFLGTAALLSLLFTAFAYFDDIEASIENSFEVGTWDVDVDGGGDSASHIFQGLSAGQSGALSWMLTNTGSVSAYVDLTIGVTDVGSGDLGDFLQAHIYVSGGGDIYTGPLSGATGPHDFNLPLDDGQSRTVVLDWLVNDGYTGIDPNDKVTFTISFSIHPAP